MKNILLERHKDLQNMTIRAKITIDKPEDPTVLDIMTDMRALPGIVTVRQTQPVSEPLNSVEEPRIIELKVSYIPSYVKQGMLSDDPEYVARTLKKVEGVHMIKIVGHDDSTFNFKIQKRPIVV